MKIGFGAWCVLVASAAVGCAGPAVRPHAKPWAVDAPATIHLPLMTEHIQTLCSPAFAGREPLSEGGLLAVDYIAEHFYAYGLESWPPPEALPSPQGVWPERAYGQFFGAGVNVVGVLPGGDPALAHEFVVLSAHHDHLGTRSGELYAGAADNAAGVAVLLETARVLAASPVRPARSVVFAAFDAEERGLLGAYAFTGRPDFDAARFAGLVNLDMLGRSTFDTRDNTLIAVGTRRFRRLRAALAEAGRDAGIEVLPIGRALVGPRSDHVPFEALGRPWVFLTCGTFGDYHTPRDTPDRLDYSAVERSARVVLDAVLALADAQAVEAPVEPTAGDREELDAVIALTGGLAPALPPALAPAVEAIHRHARGLRDAPEYTLQDNASLYDTLNLALAPVVSGRALSFKEIRRMLEARRFYLDQTEQYVASRRAAVLRAYGLPGAPGREPSPEGADGAVHSHDHAH